MTSIDSLKGAERNKTYGMTDAEIVARFAPDGCFDQYHVLSLGKFSDRSLADFDGFVAGTLEGYLEYHDGPEGYESHIERSAAAIARLWDWQNS